MGRGQNINILGVWKKFISTLIDNFEGFKISLEEGTADVVNTVRQLDIEMEPKDMTELLQYHDKPLRDKELLVMDQQRKCFLEIGSTSGKDVVKTWNSNKSFRILHKLSLQAVRRFGRIDSNFQITNTVGMDVRVGLWRKMSSKKLTHLNCGVGEDPWESLGLQGDPISSS